MTRQLYLVAMTATLVLGLVPLSAVGSDFQSEDVIRKAVERFVQGELSNSGTTTGRTTVEVGRLDPRLRLPACDKKLEAFLPPGGKLIGGATIGVRCTGGKPWSLYVPAKVGMRIGILIANRPLARGARLSPEDLRMDERDAATLTQGYLTDPQQAYGQVLKRSLSVGAPLVPAALEPPLAIKKGDRVTVVAKSAGGIEVRMAGTALTNGAAGDRIRVRNLNSERVVEGTVAGGGIVEVTL